MTNPTHDNRNYSTGSGFAMSNETISDAASADLEVVDDVDDSDCTEFDTELTPSETKNPYLSSPYGYCGAPFEFSWRGYNWKIWFRSKSPGFSGYYCYMEQTHRETGQRHASLGYYSPPSSTNYGPESIEPFYPDNLVASPFPLNCNKRQNYKDAETKRILSIPYGKALGDDLERSHAQCGSHALDFETAPGKWFSGQTYSRTKIQSQLSVQFDAYDRALTTIDSQPSVLSNVERVYQSVDSGREPEFGQPDPDKYMDISEIIWTCGNITFSGVVNGEDCSTGSVVSSISGRLSDGRLFEITRDGQ